MRKLNTLEMDELWILRLGFFYVKTNHFQVKSDGFIKNSRFQSTQDGHSVCLFVCFLF